MKKINATYGMSKEKVTNQVAKEYMNMSASKNKMMKKEGVNRAHRYLETKPGSLEEAVLIARGLMEAKGTKYHITMKDASYFKGNDIRKAMIQTKKDGNSDKALDNLDLHSGDDEEGISIIANNPSEAVRNAEKAILDYRNKQVDRDRNALFVFNGLELQLVTKFKDKGKSSDGDGTLPTSNEKNIFKNVLNKYSNEAMFNTPNGKGPSDLQRFVEDEALDEMAVQGAM
jgi:hypothetical protein